MSEEQFGARYDCVFYAYHECHALSKMLCKERECPFFRTKEEMDAARKRANV